MFTSAIIYSLIAISFFTAFLSGVAGMAGGMILMGVMAWILPLQAAMILHGSTQLVSNGWRAFIHRKHIMRGTLGLYIFGLLTSLFIFQLFQFTVERSTTFIVLGLLPVLTYLPKSIFHVDILKKSHAYVCGMIVTCLQLTAGVSGGALDVFFLNKELTRHQVVATKAVTQALGHMTKLYYFGFALKNTGDFDVSTIPPLLIAGLIIMTVVGTTLSKKTLAKIKDHHFYHGTRILITLIGIVYVWKGINLLQ